MARCSAVPVDVATRCAMTYAMQVEKKGVVEKLQTIQDTCLQVQQSMDVVASMIERVGKYVSRR